MTIAQAIDKLIADQNERHAWLFEAGEKIRKMNAEEAERFSREPGAAEKAARAISR